ncbi:MAG: Mur ligase domain-containing protein, partial [Spirochaetaceae bacterium]|nr:Mur ligase domain-containing protein [Spirochaetaceae bacterium]
MTADREGFLKPSGLARSLNADFLCCSGPAHGPRAEESFSSVSIDSRSVGEGALFVALKGSADDGHKYVASAFEKGARAALVCRASLDKNEYGLRDSLDKGSLIAVDDTLRGLQDAARIYLEQ